MKKVKKTNAARILDELQIEYELKTYPVDEEHLDAVHVAKETGMRALPSVRCAVTVTGMEIVGALASVP